MRESSSDQRSLRFVSVIPSLTAGGVGSVCRYAAEGIARHTDWAVTLLCLHDAPGIFHDDGMGFRIVGLGLDANCSRAFLAWMDSNPQDMVMTSDVSRMEPAFRFLPPATRHVLQIHDSGRRYRDVAVRHAASVDGVTCVGRHIEAPLRRSLNAVGFRGLLHTVHNGANFPTFKEREPYTGPLRLLFVGRVDALKGVFDFVLLLERLNKLGVPFILNLVGGENEALRRRFQRKGLSEVVRWTGCVSHELCYDIASESDLVLVPSRKESFGMVTVEAMSMGCVPMAYDIASGSTEIIEHGKSGLLVPLGDYRAWAAEIQALHADRPSLALLAVGAIQRARTHFSAEVMSANLTAFLRDVMDHAERQPSLREEGLPPEEPAVHYRPARGYQRLPAGLRTWIRNWVCARPRLSYWLLNR
jgi:glycosyltransferase involved in cell wall biosynthesis